ncbi:MAG TPA: ATP-binding protein [Chitinophagaceae bacterium]|nr:ATP-binding protein [Chitinophagaceae bacterium]
MLKRVTYTICLFFVTIIVHSQEDYGTDSLKNELRSAKTDTAELILLGSIAYNYAELNPDSAFLYASRMHVLAKKMKLPLEECFALSEMGYALINLGNYPRSLQILLAAVEITDDPESENNLLSGFYIPIDVYTDRTAAPKLQRLTKQARAFQYLGILYGNSGNLGKAVEYYQSTLQKAELAKNERLLSISYTTLGRTYLSLNKKDSALWCADKANEYAIKSGFQKYLGSILLNQGRVYMTLGRQKEAEMIFFAALRASTDHKYYRGIAATNLALADIHKQFGERDSVFYYIQKGLAVARFLNAPDLYLRSYKALAEYYKTDGNNDSVVKYQSHIIKINDSLFNSKQTQDFQNIDFNNQQRIQEIEATNAEYRNEIKIYFLLAGLGIFLLVALMLWRNSRQRKLRNILLSKQKNDLENALESLKSTQSQLVQSEKMASLGELTAGIAHEIQNPLNFVNNFSEVNSELISELVEEVDKGNTAEVKLIAADIKDNSEKINHHGKRADAIVKGMLQHSRSSSGQKEATDINALADEYLRLSYHGLRAKDKSFNATLKTDFDSSIGLINIIPQDIGRVILNLITNAFYVVNERQKAESGKLNAEGKIYEPTVEVSTRKVKDNVEVKVKDNGNGIPQKIIDKIFQPFFTTKPTGQGTGLGLSLSYDIVKAHGGELKVETKEGEGSEFIIVLPL